MKRALFLDRDGVINKEYNYVYKIENFDFIPEIFNLCKYYQDLGYIIIVITNQAGIARGYYTEQQFNILTDWMIDQFKNREIEIKRVYFCPHHPEITGTCICRKPNPGMIMEAASEFDIDLKNSVLIGDKDSDLEAGKNAGILNLFHINDVINSYLDKHN